MSLARLALPVLSLATLLAPGLAAAETPVGAGLATSGGAVSGMVTGGIAGGLTWAVLDQPDCAGRSNDLCPMGGVVRGLAFGVPLGGGLTSAATGALTHQLVVGHGSSRVLLVGLAPVALGTTLQALGLSAAQGDDMDLALGLIAAGGGLSLLGPTVATGLMSAHESRHDAPLARRPRVDSVAFAPLDGGAKLGISGSF